MVFYISLNLFLLTQTSNGYCFLENNEKEWRCSPKSRNRWFLAHTLIRNPQLASQRKSCIQALGQVEYANHGDVKIEISNFGVGNSGY